MTFTFKHTMKRSTRRKLDQFEADDMTDQDVVDVVTQCRASFGKEDNGATVATTWGYAVVYTEHIAKAVVRGQLKEQGVFQTFQRLIVTMYDPSMAVQFRLMFP